MIHNSIEANAFSLQEIEKMREATVDLVINQLDPTISNTLGNELGNKNTHDNHVNENCSAISAKVNTEM